ncbi:hypothetical protein Xthr_14195 [Xanthomonas citri pv. thirumalacharii]|nr:hypothetical protein [Xanthomonas citri pv. thirumalacharii]
MRVLLTIVAWILERLTTGSEQVQALQWYASAAAYERSLPRVTHARLRAPLAPAHGAYSHLVLPRSAVVVHAQAGV